jgi:Fe-S-cluster containining protein
MQDDQDDAARQERLDNARQALREQRAELNAGEILRRAPGLLNERLVPTARRYASDTTRGRMARYGRLVQLAEGAMQAIAPNAPCKKGCNYCCHIAVPIMQHEAEAIGRKVGRAPRVVENPRSAEQVGVLKRRITRQYAGVPCTFLGAEGECTVYDVRPLPCRAYHSIYPDAEPCDVKRFPGGKVPHINLRPIEWAAAELFLREPIADIREFFPKEG